MAVLTSDDASQGGVVTLVAAEAGGDQVESGADAGGWELPVVLVVVNGSGASVDVTVEGAVTAVGAGATAIIPIRGAVGFGDLVSITYSDVASVTVGAVRLARLG